MFGSRKPKILIKGSLTERPWAATLTAISTAELSGQLTLCGEGNEYRLAFSKGLPSVRCRPHRVTPCSGSHSRATPCRRRPSAAMRIGRSDDAASSQTRPVSAARLPRTQATRDVQRGAHVRRRAR
jgi:hypothetical protein